MTKKEEISTWEIKAIFNWADIEESQAYCDEHWVEMNYDWKKGTMYFKWPKKEIEKIKKLFSE